MCSAKRWPSRCSISWQNARAVSPSPSASNHSPSRSWARTRTRLGRVTMPHFPGTLRQPSSPVCSPLWCDDLRIHQLQILLALLVQHQTDPPQNPHLGRRQPGAVGVRQRLRHIVQQHVKPRVKLWSPGGRPLLKHSSPCTTIFRNAMMAPPVIPWRLFHGIAIHKNMQPPVGAVPLQTLFSSHASMLPGWPVVSPHQRAAGSGSGC